MRTNGSGTITVNQFQDRLENHLGDAKIQNAIDAIDNTGSGRNTINVADGTYTENLVIDHANISLVGAPGATIEAENIGDDLIRVEASNVTIDPFVLDGLNKVRYGISAKGDGASGLVVDGNTFRNLKEAGLWIGYMNGGVATITNNVVEGSTEQAVRSGPIMDGSVLNITGNVFGSDADPTDYVAVNIGRVTDSEVFVNGNEINSDSDGIKFAGVLNSQIGISGNDIVSDAAGINFVPDNNGVVLSNSNVDIAGNNVLGGWYGISFLGGDLADSSVIDIVDNDNIEGFADGIVIADDVFGGVSVNIHGNGTGTSLPSGYVGFGGISSAFGNGVDLYGVETSDIGNNYIHDVGADGIHVENFASTWIAYNHIIGVGDDGIEVVDGGFASIYGNTIQGVGTSPIVSVSLVAPENSRSAEPIRRKDLYGSDGIHVRNVGGIEVLSPSIEAENGRGRFRADTGIYGNKISLMADDGIEVVGGNNTYIGNNIVGHVGDDGIAVERTRIAEIMQNTISLTGDDGIYVDGIGGRLRKVKPKFLVAENDAIFAGRGIYAGISGNKILLAGGDGIEVGNIGNDILVLKNSSNLVRDGQGYGHSGWAVDVTGNEVAMTGDNGIWVHDSSSANISDNDVFMAGMGADLGSVISLINDFASGSPTVAVAADITTGDTDLGSFIWNWGDGDGIRVNNIYDYGYRSRRENVRVQGNTIVATGGHGIDVFNARAARIIGNEVSYSGLDFSRFAGYFDILDLLNNGPFNDHSGYFGDVPVRTLITSDRDFEEDSYPTRRDLWVSSPERMIDIVKGYVPFPRELGYDSFDGIHVGNVGLGVANLSAENALAHPAIYDLGLPYSVVIQGNNINHTGDDGIEVADSGRTLIGGYGEGEGNFISNVGYGRSGGGYAPDYSGADGIRVSGISNYGGYGPVGIVNISANGSGDYGYAAEIINNDISRTQDDGIEAVYSESVLIDGNNIRWVGLGSDVSGRRYGLGSDGIYVRGIYSSRGFDSDVEAQRASLESIEPSSSSYDVKIVNNTVDRTQDDGIEVLYSGSALIADNVLRNIGGYRGVHTEPAVIRAEDAAYYNGDGYLGSRDADGIHVVSDNFQGYKLVAAKGHYPGYYGYGGRVDIVRNNITNVSDDGIDVRGASELLIDRNTISNVGDDGIVAYGYGGRYYYDDAPSSEFLRPSVVYRPRPYSFYDAVITNNNIANAGGDGIQASGFDSLDVSDNTVISSARNGVYISGFYNGDVTFQGNVLVNNGGYEATEGGEILVGAGARFESGNIDFSDLTRPNLFINTSGTKAVAMQFDPALGGEFETISPASIEAEYSAEAFVPSDLTIVNETLGGTQFFGYSPLGSYYVRFEDGAILDNLGNVIVIDGQNASFDGIVPASFGGVMAPSTLNFIEDRLWDADDPAVNGRGQIFVGEAAAGIDNIEDFFREFGGSAAPSRGFNVTFLGLPPVGPTNLAGIAPAAGGNEGEDATGEDVAAIAPAAGDAEGEDVTCWSDLGSSLESGKPVSLSDDGSMEGALKQVAGCSSRNI